MSSKPFRTLRGYESANNICSGDCCVDAVRRAYRDLVESGNDEPLAFDVALTVFNWHHPEISRHSAKNLVRGWVRERLSH